MIRRRTRGARHGRGLVIAAALAAFLPWVAAQAQGQYRITKSPSAQDAVASGPAPSAKKGESATALEAKRTAPAGKASVEPGRHGIDRPPTCPSGTHPEGGQCVK
jgi:hypothetical protein